MISFDAATHTYAVNGDPKGSVTWIMRCCGLSGSYEFMDPIHKFRGSSVHAGSALLIDGTEPHLHPLQPPHSNDPKYRQVHTDIPMYWEACRTAKVAIGFTGCLYECPFVDPVRGYGGTPDFLAYTGKRDQLWDLKSGTFPVMTVVQLCGYEDLARCGKPVNPAHPGLGWLLSLVNSGRPIERCGLRLEKTGRFTAYYECPKGRSYQDPMWMSAWRSALCLYTTVPDHQYVETAPDGVVLKKSHLSDMSWVAERIKTSLKGAAYDSAMRAGSNLFNLRQAYNLL